MRRAGKIRTFAAIFFCLRSPSVVPLLPRQVKNLKEEIVHLFTKRPDFLCAVTFTFPVEYAIIMKYE